MKTKLIALAFLFLFCSIRVVLFGQVFPTQADHDRVVDSFLNVLKIAKDDTNKVKSLLALSREYSEWSEDDRPKSIEKAELAKSFSEKLNYQSGKAVACQLLGKNFSGLKKYGQALEYYSDALNIWQKEKVQQGIIECYWGLGWIYAEQHDYDKTLNYFNLALNMAGQTGDKKTIAGAYQALAMFYLHSDPPKYPEALRYYLTILKIGEESGDKEMMWAAGNQVGISFLFLKDYSQALKYFLGMKKNTGNGAPLSNLLICYRNLRNYPEGINAINVFIEKYEKLNNKRNVAYGLGQAGLVYKEMAEDLYHKNSNYDTILNCLDRALKSFDASKKLEKEYGLKNSDFGTHFDYGIIYKLKAELLLKKAASMDTIRKILDAALNYFKDQLNDAGKEKNKKQEAACLVKSGEVVAVQASFAGNEAQKKYEEAIKYLDHGLLIAKAIPDKSIVRDAYRELAKIHEKLKSYDKSLFALKYYDEVKDSLKTEENKKTIEQMKVVSETIIGATEEKATYERVINRLNFNYTKKEDSLKFQERIAQERLNQQQKEVQLKQTELALANKQSELNQLAYLKTQAELQSEQSQRHEKEKQLKIAEQEKALQTAQLELKENQIQSEKRQRFFYIGGIILFFLLFVFAYSNFKNRQRAERLIAEEKLRTEKITTANKMTELELQSLRAQLNPHFMFNSLNAIQELILKEDNDNSHLYLSRFSELLRMLLDNANQPFVCLRKEINLLELYLSLENLRIPDLKYTIEIDPAIDSNRIAIPNMMLQPYIENAIWHGLSHKKGERNLNIRISKKGENVVCEVEDNGVGRKMATELKSLYRKEHRSRGMELLSRRFNLLSKEYGADIQTTIEDLHDNGKATGTRVAITVPYSITEQAKPVYS